MNRYELEKRMRELGIYSDFFQRKELKSLAQMLKDNEVLNCILTGVNNANRKMLAITDRRILILFVGPLASGEFKVVKRSAVKDYWFHKKLFFSDAGFTTEGGESFSFTNTQGSLRDLYEWAMARPIPS